jgi:hypothetical protein
MVDSRANDEGALILTPHDAQRLRQACPDLHEWPKSWHVEPADIALGQRIVQVLTPFLLDRLAKTTVRRHRDNLWLLGGELIRRRYDDAALARQDIQRALQQLIHNDGGPLIWPRITESEQDSLDATCRKLHRFMQDSAAAGSSAQQTAVAFARSGVKGTVE